MRDFLHDDKDALADDDDTVATAVTASKNTSDTGNLGVQGDDDDDDVLTHEIANCFLALLDAPADVNK